MMNSCIHSTIIRWLTVILASVFFSTVTEAQRQIRPQAAYKFGEYMYTTIEAEKEHLRPFAEELRRHPKARACIIGYGDSFFRYGDVIPSQRAGYARLSLVYLVGSSIGWDNVKIIDGGYRDREMVELYVVPAGAKLPQPSPTVPATNVTFCPLITAYSNPYVWRLDRPVRFGAAVKYDNRNVMPKFDWNVSAGKIVKGQGTTEIEVVLPKGEYRSITATLRVNGFPSACPAEESVASPSEMWAMPYKFDESEVVGCEDEMARLDNLAVNIQADPEMNGYIIVYGSSSGDRRGEVRKEMARIKHYLTQNRRIPSDRLAIVHGGYRVKMTVELWLMPKFAKEPAATPTVEPKEVRFRRGRVRKWEYDCNHLGV